MKQNTASAEDDTLMGTDVCSNVIRRLMEFGCGRGRDSSTLTCVHDNVKLWALNPSYEGGQRPRARLKLRPAASEFWVARPPAG